MITSSKPFSNTPERQQEAVWIIPQFVVKVQFMEWSSRNTMRHPTTQAILKEANITDCTFRQLEYE